MQPRPTSPAALASLVADRAELLVTGDRTVGLVGVDGADPAAGTAALADAAAAELATRGTAAVRVSTPDFLRPASLRLEFGRDDPDAFVDDWFDAAALRREVVTPLRPGGTGRYLPTYWDAGRDRATRAAYRPAPTRGVLLLDGALLLTLDLDLDLVVHLTCGPGALARRTPAELTWTLPAYERYAEQWAPADAADLVARVDDPRHPALVADRWHEQGGPG